MRSHKSAREIAALNSTEQALRLFVGAQIVLATAGTLIIVPVFNIDVGLDRFMGTILLGVLLLAAVGDVLIVRFFVIPSVSTKPEAAYETILAPAYAATASPAIFGVVAAVMNGQALLVLPFSAISVIAFFSTSNAMEELRLSEERASIMNGSPDQRSDSSAQ